MAITIYYIYILYNQQNNVSPTKTQPGALSPQLRPGEPGAVGWGGDRDGAGMAGGGDRDGGLSWVIKCPHFSHHPTMIGIWSINVYNGYYKVMSNIPKSWDSYQPLIVGIETLWETFLRIVWLKGSWDFWRGFMEFKTCSIFGGWNEVHAVAVTNTDHTMMAKQTKRI